MKKIMLLITSPKLKYFLFLVICIIGMLYTYLVYRSESNVHTLSMGMLNNNSKSGYQFEVESITLYENGYNIKGWGKFENDQFQEFDKHIVLLDSMTGESMVIPTSYINVDLNASSSEVLRDTTHFHATVFYKYLIKDHTYQIMILDDNTLTNTEEKFTYGES